jgi:hypothetical protein
LRKRSEITPPDFVRGGKQAANGLDDIQVPVYPLLDGVPECISLRLKIRLAAGFMLVL